MYRIIDRQGMGIMESRVFKTKADIVKALADYHDIDFTGCIDDNGEDKEVSIYEFLNENFKTIEEKLNYLLDYGEWGFDVIRKEK